MVKTKSKVSGTLLVLLLALSAFAFLVYVPQPAAATSGNCEIAYTYPEGAGTATGIYGILSIHQANWDRPAYQEQKVWATMILMEGGGNNNFAEVNLVATCNWLLGTWSWEVHFTWKDGSTVSGTWNPISGYWGQQVYMYCGESSGNTWVAQYSFNGQTWYNIGSGSYTYSSHWHGGVSKCGLETLHPATAGQTVKITSTEQVLVQSNNYNWHYWTPSDWYNSPPDSYASYNVIDHTHVTGGWESQVIGWAEIYISSTFEWYGLNPGLYADYNYVGTQPMYYRCPSGTHSFQTDASCDGYYAADIYLDGSNIGWGTNTGSISIPDHGDMYLEWYYY